MTPLNRTKKKEIHIHTYTHLYIYIYIQDLYWILPQPLEDIWKRKYELQTPHLHKRRQKTKKKEKQLQFPSPVEQKTTFYPLPTTSLICFAVGACFFQLLILTIQT